MLETRDHIELTPAAVERGYKSCRSAVKTYFKNQVWMAGNLPADRRRALDALMTHLIRALDFLDLESPNLLPLDVWTETRDDVSDSFNQKCTSVELAALADACLQFSVPKQYLFDMLEGADWWTRNPTIDSFDDLLVMAYRLGGTAVVASVPILGFIKPDYEVPAIRCGQAIVLTHAIANCVSNLTCHRNLIPRSDFEECGVDLSRFRLRQYSKNVGYLVRLYCSRIEEVMNEARYLIDYMDFDGVRTIKSLLSYHWKMMVKMKMDPECILHPEGVLSPREKLGLKTRHLLGIEGNIPLFANRAGH